MYYSELVRILARQIRESSIAVYKIGDTLWNVAVSIDRDLVDSANESNIFRRPFFKVVSRRAFFYRIHNLEFETVLCFDEKHEARGKYAIRLFISQIKSLKMKLLIACGLLMVSIAVNGAPQAGPQLDLPSESYSPGCQPPPCPSTGNVKVGFPLDCLQYVECVNGVAAVTACPPDLFWHEVRLAFVQPLIFN